MNAQVLDLEIFDRVKVLGKNPAVLGCSLPRQSEGHRLFYISERFYFMQGLGVTT